MSPIISTLSNSWSSGSKPVVNILGGFQGSSTSSIDSGGLLIYHGSHAEQTHSNSQFSFTVDAAGTFYIAMIGGAGAVQTVAGVGGHGGIGILEVTVPESAVGTRFYVNQGGAGRRQTYELYLTSITSAGPGGGKGGVFCGVYTQYSRHTGGGAMTTISSQSSTSAMGNSFAFVGGGGGGGARGNNGQGSSGGGFDMSGSARETGSTWSGLPGTTTSGGSAGVSSAVYGVCTGTEQAGSALEGGNGSGSSYDSGAGGGSGYYGGGGGTSGGGYNAGNGGGGSGKTLSSNLPTGVTMSIAQLSGTNLTDDGQVNSRDPWNQLQTWISSLVGSTVTIPANTSGEEYGQIADTLTERDGSAGCAVVWTKQ